MFKINDRVFSQRHGFGFVTSIDSTEDGLEYPVWVRFHSVSASECFTPAGRAEASYPNPHDDIIFIADGFWAIFATTQAEEQAIWARGTPMSVGDLARMEELAERKLALLRIFAEEETALKVFPNASDE